MKKLVLFIMTVGLVITSCAFKGYKIYKEHQQYEKEREWYDTDMLLEVYINDFGDAIPVNTFTRVYCEYHSLVVLSEEESIPCYFYKEWFEEIREYYKITFSVVTAKDLNQLVEKNTYIKAAINKSIENHL